MSGAGGNEGRVSGLAVASAIVGGLWAIGQITYAVGAATAAGLYYWYLCSRHPMAKCTACEGGRVWNDARTHFGYCRKCRDAKGDSKGFHVRWGRRMWDKRVAGEEE